MHEPMPIEVDIEGTRFRIDVFRPENQRDRQTAVIVIHGGGWRLGGPQDVYAHASRLADRGFGAICIEYRLLDTAPWPAQIQDVRSIIRYVRDAPGEFGVQAGNIAVMGFSAGGQLALLGALEEGVRAVIAISPITEFTASGTEAGVDGAWPLDRLLGPAAPGELEPAFSEALPDPSPMRSVTTGYPPTLLIHGTADTSVPHQASLRLFDRLSELGTPVDLVLLSGLDHLFEYGESYGEAIADSAELFLRRFVAEPEVIATETPTKAAVVEAILSRGAGVDAEARRR